MPKDQSKDTSTSSHQAQVRPFTFTSRRPPISESFPVSKLKSKSKPKKPKGPWKGPPIFCQLGCAVPTHRKQDWNRHFLKSHLPDSIYCHNPGCGWQGSRKEELSEHIEQKKCGPKPEFEEQRMIYDVGLILNWIREDIVSVEVAQMFAVDLVEERARELGKANLWEDPWIKLENK
jgi:hypothetical protein